jgi:hypothetical protein
MASKTITRPQYEALRNAAPFGEELLSPVDALRGRSVVDARANTCAVLVRLGVAEEVQGQTVLTRAGELVAVTLTHGGELVPLDTVAYYVANAGEENRPTDGTYYPSAEHARTWREASPLWLDGRRVSAVVANGGRDLYVYLGTETIYDGDMPGGIQGNGDVHTWVRQYAIGYVWAAEYRTLWSYRDHAGHVWGPYSDKEFAHTDGNAERYCRGIVDTTGAGEVIRIDRRPSNFQTTGRNWTDVRTVTHVAIDGEGYDVRVSDAITYDHPNEWGVLLVRVSDSRAFGIDFPKGEEWHSARFYNVRTGAGDILHPTTYADALRAVLAR